MSGTNPHGQRWIDDPEGEWQQHVPAEVWMKLQHAIQVAQNEARVSYLEYQRCPVCEGRGTVYADFYLRLGSSTGTAREVCRTCVGKGMVKRPDA